LARPLLGQLFERLREEGLTVSYTMEDFKRDLLVEELRRATPEKRREALGVLSPEERRELIQSVPPEERLASLSEEQVRQFLDQLVARRGPQPRKPRRKR
jgi:hypothetical protein